LLICHRIITRATLFFDFKQIEKSPLVHTEAINKARAKQVIQGWKEVSDVENELKEKIDEIIKLKAESVTDELSDSEHGYVDALIWLKDGSIQLSNEGIGKEMVNRSYADPQQSTKYYEGYNAALQQVLKILTELKTANPEKRA
jgi:hypothetical protein